MVLGNSAIVQCTLVRVAPGWHRCAAVLFRSEPSHTAVVSHVGVVFPIDCHFVPAHGRLFQGPFASRLFSLVQGAFFVLFFSWFVVFFACVFRCVVLGFVGFCWVCVVLCCMVKCCDVL